jgi:hypothetical protein
MALESNQITIGHHVAAADLSTKQFYVVKMTSTGWNVAGAGEGEGILQDTPNALGQAALVAVGGTSKAVAGAALAKGAYVASDASGKLKAAVLGRTDTSDAGAAADPLLGSNVLGKLLQASGADGDIVEVLILNLGAVPTTAQ